MLKLSLWKTIFLVCVFCAVGAIGSPAQTLRTLVSFDGTDGDGPAGSLVQGIDGNFYGITGVGGTKPYGTVFKITAGGKLTTLYSFCAQTGCTDGAGPQAGLVQATNGNFYGTTIVGGTNDGCSVSASPGCGTVFEITAGGKLTTLHSFCAQADCTDGEVPFAGLVQATDGDFYGTTTYGGVFTGCDAGHGCGTVFRITPGGKLTRLHSFNGTDGESPYYGGLVQATDGNFYGTTEFGGANHTCTGDCGTVFKISPAGKLTTLHNFDSTDGAWPYAGLVQATDGNFYGTTYSGGANGNGTVFEITVGGKLTTLYSFCAQTHCADGASPFGLLQATNGNFYGTTSTGGANGWGTVFEITAGGKLTTLYSFCAQKDCTDGLRPWGGLVQATNGNFYGITLGGGKYSDGTVFTLAVGLGPFVETRPTSGKAGATVIILGNNLSGATSVTFDGTAAAFTVVSSSEIKTTVPSGATTGKVKVTTPSGTLTSNVNFRVP